MNRLLSSLVFSQFWMEGRRELPMTNNEKIVWLLIMLLTVAIPRTRAQVVAASSPTLGDARPYWVGLSVPDAEASASWYREHLHFTVKKRLILPDRQLKIVFLELNGYSIELVENKNATSFDTVRKRVPEIKDRDNLHGVFKIGFLVGNVDGLAVELKRRGTRLVSEPSDDRAFGVRQFLVEDNAGNVLQFFQALK